ncbi:MAG: HD domain-containing protein [Treponema sp.]|nr:HD domain-containing protein [Treponema sp.]
MGKKDAALLHDVGKIGIDEAIINKKGKLTEEEFNEIKKHTIWGWEILSNYDQQKKLPRHYAAGASPKRNRKRHGKPIRPQVREDYAKND